MRVRTQANFVPGGAQCRTCRAFGRGAHAHDAQAPSRPRMKRVQQLYNDAERAFDDRASRRQLRVPEDILDTGNDLIHNRLELHTSIPADLSPITFLFRQYTLSCQCVL